MKTKIFLPKNVFFHPKP